MAALTPSSNSSGLSADGVGVTAGPGVDVGVGLGISVGAWFRSVGEETLLQAATIKARNGAIRGSIFPTNFVRDVGSLNMMGELYNAPERCPRLAGHALQNRNRMRRNHDGCTIGGANMAWLWRKRRFIPH